VAQLPHCDRIVASIGSRDVQIAIIIQDDIELRRLPLGSVSTIRPGIGLPAFLPRRRDRPHN
jgi:hypothetical protein